METKGIIISQKYYERLTDIEKNFDAKFEKEKKDYAQKEKAKRIKDHKAAFGLYQEVITNQKKSIRNLWWAFGIMFVAWLTTFLIAYIY